MKNSLFKRIERLEAKLKAREPPKPKLTIIEVVNPETNRICESFQWQDSEWITTRFENGTGEYVGPNYMN